MYFIGLTFHQNFVHFKKLDSFRRQFDPHYFHCKTLQMTMLPPFELPSKGLSQQSGRGIDTLCSQIEEDLDCVFFGQDRFLKVDFKKIEFSFDKKPMIFLRPELPEELVFAQETMAKTLEDWEVRFKRRGKKFYETLLPIARPKKEYITHQAISMAQSDFTFPLSLYVSGMVVFEKLPGYWPIIKRVYHCDLDHNEIRPYELGLRKEQDRWAN